MKAIPWSRVAVLATALTLGLPAQAAGPEWFEQALERHPSWLEAQAEQDAAKARREAASRPRYNPEVGMDVEQGEVLTLSAGVSQTIDRAGLRGALSRSAEARLRAAEARLAQRRLDLAHELLHLIVRNQNTHERLRIASERVDLMHRFVEISEKRLASGDLDSSAMALARLAEAEARMARAQVAAELSQSEQDLALWFPGEDLHALPLALAEVPPLPGPLDEAGLQERLPTLRALAAEVEAARAEVAVRQRERRANPTLSLNAGREGEAALLGLSLSLPWNVRNPYLAEVDAARAESEAMRARLDQARRDAIVRLRANHARYRILRQAWEEWQQGGRAGLEGQLEALERLWSVGELEADAYLLRLKQTLDTREQVVSLRQDLWLAWLDLRHANGDLLQRLPRFIRH